jgi:hypothetical protein
MINSHDFADKQLDLAGEFGKYVFAHPEVDDLIPNGAYVYFQVEGDPGFNEYSRALAEGKRAAGIPVILVRLKGLVPVQGSRLVDPIIEPIPA